MKHFDVRTPAVTDTTTPDKLYLSIENLWNPLVLHGSQRHFAGH